ncbi:unnamed protein product [Oncorhynchus mykiss]|uniref:AP-3 complex subunit beta n=1 Tax=Oncorhynchus mykiss TaxID=8022 RepID=A0A060W1P3_ONCMY|nr:unnamed protein product [Oncorhynchus mykiss]
MTPMQKLLQLPVNAMNMVKTAQDQMGQQDEAKSPVMTPDGGNHNWYNGEPNDPRHIRFGSGGGDQEERAHLEEGGGSLSSLVTQPLRHDDLKEMLDSNKDSLKLEAMKRIVAMIARGKNASDLFPAVVKNVACKNIEVKKLVYVYLVRYAEEQQDLALLSISTFQRGLKVSHLAHHHRSSIRYPTPDPNLNHWRETKISDPGPVVSSLSPLSISSVHLFFFFPFHSLSLSQINSQSIVNSEIRDLVFLSLYPRCPTRSNLVQKAGRLIHLLSCLIATTPVRARERRRMKVISPPIHNSTKPHCFLTQRASNPEASRTNVSEETPCTWQPWLARTAPGPPQESLVRDETRISLPAKPSLTRTTLCQLCLHVINYINVLSRPPFLSPCSEVQYVVLQNVATMSIKRRGMFEPYLKSFYIRSTDPTQIKVLKLEVLTNLANETNISTILREFQTYIKSNDKDFVAATIQAIGRCATNIGEVRDTCLNGLVQLLSNRDELVVAESVVVIKKLLQMQPEQHSDIIKHMAKLTDNIQVPMARASILWLIGEYCEHVPKIAPDVLRKMAKTFTNEEDIVKLQIINLAAKLYLTNSKQTKLLTQYVLNLAKYDQNYDIRDRARFIRQLIVPTDKSGALSKYAKKLFLALKPAPVLESPFKDRDHFQLGSLSHLLNAKAGGYQVLPDWPEAAPDPSVRNVEVKESIEEVITSSEGRIGLLGDTREVITLLERVTTLTSVPEWTKCSSREKRKEKKADKPFYSDSEGESGPTESADSASDTASGSESGSGSEESGSGSESEESNEDSESASEEDEEEEGKKKKKNVEKIKARKPVPESESEPSSGEEVKKSEKKSKPRIGSSESESEEDDDSESESSESEEEESEEESEEETKKKKKTTASKPPSKPPKKENKKEKKEMSLLDFDDFDPAPSPSQVTPLNNFLSSSLVTDLEGLSLTDNVLSPTTIVPSGNLKTYELLHRITGEGLSVEYCFSRQPFSPDPHMVAVKIQFTNSATSEAKSLHVEDAKLQSGMRIKEFPEIEVLPAGETVSVVMGIDFCDSTQAANFQLCTHTRKFFVSIQPPVGELMMPIFMTENEFKKEQGQLMGMNEITEKLTLEEKCQGEHAVVQRVTTAANLSRVPCGSDKECRFAGKTVTSGSLVLVSVVTKEDGAAQLTVNCEKMVIGTMLVKDILQALTQ